MGCCPSDPVNKDWNKQLAKERKNDREVKKLLFLGSGGSGKSTLFKQLRTIHGEGYDNKDRLQFRDHIYTQIIEQMRLAVSCVQILKEEEPDEYKDTELTPAAEEAIQVLSNVSKNQVSREVARAIKILWAESAIKHMFELRAQLNIEDSSKYFWEEVDRISESEYIPSDTDILLVRYRTTGVVEQSFTMKGNSFNIFDVGGQRNERKKWIHCFENVTCVIFVAALSCYDEVMFEDEEVNSMHDSLELFGKICNNHWFTDTAVILFLNKKDLFEDKIINVPLTVCFPNYDQDPHSYEETTEFLKEAFHAQLNEANSDKQIFTHLTCATDKNNVDKVFNDIQTVIINASLAQGGLM